MTNKEFIDFIKKDGEEWKDVVGYEGFYQVSSFGRIAVLSRLVERIHRNGKSANFYTKPHLCSTSTAPSSNYRRITFVVGRKKQTRLVHRIVAEAFLPNPQNNPCVDHIDDNPQNNHVSNLQWCSYKTNNSKEHHRTKSSFSHIRLLPEEKRGIVSIDTFGNVKIYDSVCMAAKDGHTKHSISNVLNKRKKTHHGFVWMYLSEYNTLVNQ